MDSLHLIQKENDKSGKTKRMMRIMNLIYPFMAGLLMGVFYFGGLWFTVRKLPYTDSPALWVFVSFGFRLMIVLIGFYIIMGSHWENAVVALVGFVLVRLFLVRRISISKKRTNEKIVHHGN